MGNHRSVVKCRIQPKTHIRSLGRVRDDKSQHYQEKKNDENSCESPVEPAFLRMPYPVAKDSRKQKSLRNDFKPTGELVLDWNGGIDHPLDGAGSRTECRQNPKTDQNPPHQKPSILLREENLSEWVEYEGKNQSPNWLKQRAGHNDWIGGLPHP